MFMRMRQFLVYEIIRHPIKRCVVGVAIRQGMAGENVLKILVGKSAGARGSAHSSVHSECK